MEALPQNSESNNWRSCFITFRAADQRRFQILVNAFEILKQEKLKLIEEMFGNDKVQSGEGDDDEQYSVRHERLLQKVTDNLFDLFDEQILSHFWWPSKQEVNEYRQRWLATPRSQRLTDPAFETPWDFESMIDAFLNGEYKLLSCRLLTPDTGILEFSPWALPYGGIGCMEALIGAFDFPIIGENNGMGYVSYL